MQFWVYMLRCCDESYYIGVTNNLEMRLHEHISGFDEGCYTYKRLPVELVYSAFFTDIIDAITWEKRIKRWTRAKKKALIQDNQNALEYAARGPERRRIDFIRAGLYGRCRVTLRRAQGDTTKTLRNNTVVSW